ncbi:aldo/keto reductase [Alkalicoccobacillus porphyridii]|uniref:Aldo/keto reductase n=1 Tax=Alkalicoccobacillus porphyridii TaxID=2597270 RepID=A0A553ZWS8_9BACI|nr:aldo/keto reductase [Alkalicoccobacillus porphyridii]TSB45901.1 aldo/keto reductase [Alkalicoccobacillus porphyridii]
MKVRKLGNSDLEVSSIGLGLMGMSPGIYGQVNDEESIKTIHRALDLGVTMLDTADVYGNGHNESLLGRALKGNRDKAIVATKFAYTKNFEKIIGHTDYIKKAVDDSLLRLNIDYIDLYYQHRVDPNVPIEETVGAMSDLVKSGKVQALGLSEASVETIKRAHNTHPITALQTEYSLWSRDIEETILPVINDLGITHIAYSPLSRGFITGEITTFKDFGDDDLRRFMPRFQGENFKKNLDIVKEIQQMADEKNVTPSQLAIAWTIANGSLPIPGTKRQNYLEENIGALDIELTPLELERLDTISPFNTVHGNRYDETNMKNLNL